MRLAKKLFQIIHYTLNALRRYISVVEDLILQSEQHQNFKERELTKNSNTACAYKVKSTVATQTFLKRLQCFRIMNANLMTRSCFVYILEVR